MATLRNPDPSVLVQFFKVPETGQVKALVHGEADDDFGATLKQFLDSSATVLVFTAELNVHCEWLP